MSRKLLGAAAVATFLGTPAAVLAHEPHQCPSGAPELPVVPAHTDHADVVQGRLSTFEVFLRGEAIFFAVFNECDGQGRPATTGGGEKRIADQPHSIRTSGPDSSSCAGCHVQPRKGGAGGFAVNVFAGAEAFDPVTESIAPDVTNERNTVSLFGSGPIEMLAREMTVELWATRDAAIEQAVTSGVDTTFDLVAKGVTFGSITAHPDGSLDTSAVEGVDPDLVIKPFTSGGVFVSIRQVSVEALNRHHGIQAEEHFDQNPDKAFDPDYDEDGVTGELTVGDVTALTIWQAELATPGRLLPPDRTEIAVVQRGNDLFRMTLGEGGADCASCHVPEFTLGSRFFTEPSPFNPPGFLNDTSEIFSFDMTRQGQRPRLAMNADGAPLVRAYTDLKRHNLCDPETDPDPIRHFCNEQLAAGRPDQGGRPGSEFFLTAKLWDAGTSAPYGHRGDLTSLTQAILAHGGEARASRDAFASLPIEDQKALIRFVKSLVVLPEEARTTRQ